MKMALQWSCNSGLFGGIN